MWSAIVAVLNIFYLLLKNKFEKDADEKKRKEALYAQAKSAISSGDISRINNVLVSLRDK